MHGFGGSSRGRGWRLRWLAYTALASTFSIEQGSAHTPHAAGSAVLKHGQNSHDDPRKGIWLVPRISQEPTDFGDVVVSDSCQIFLCFMSFPYGYVYCVHYVRRYVFCQRYIGNGWG